MREEMNTLQEAGCLTYQESPDMSDVMTIFSGGGFAMGNGTYW
jgi:hypothetical protein